MSEPSTKFTVDETQFTVTHDSETGHTHAAIIGNGSPEFAQQMVASVQKHIIEDNYRYWLINLEESHDPPNKEERRIILSLLKNNPDCAFAQYGGAHVTAAVVRFALTAFGPTNMSQFATMKEACAWLEKKEAELE